MNLSPESDEVLMWVMIVSWILKMALFSCLDCLILYTIFRLNSFTEDKADCQITQSLMKVYSDEMNRQTPVSNQKDEIADRARFERRQKEYRFLANEQIKAILTAMSISRDNKCITNSLRHNTTESDNTTTEDQLTSTLRSLTVAEERDEN